MNMYRKEEQEDEMGGQGEHMEGRESEAGWGQHGSDGWRMKKCGCPMCHMMLAMKKMSMTRGMGGMGMMPGMMHMGMGMAPGSCEKPGMGMEGASWRKFMSSDEKISKLEAYLKELQAEEKAVEEQIEHIRKKAQS